ncbi:MAG: phosphate signaling complex protein PhoU [Chloroflexi bacterium]|nr:phosphate signaling complex protein PhoU [Chloroflexota bacterium]
MKLPRLTLNLFKVVTGVLFSLLWASVMYMVWPQPSYVTFLWFYLGAGSIVLKWIIFEVIDRIQARLQLRGLARELELSRTRVQEAAAEKPLPSCPLPVSGGAVDLGLAGELKQLQCDVSSMAGRVDRAIDRAMASLQGKDLELAREIIEEDRGLDQQQTSIRDRCMRVIATTCPQAEDLHLIVAVLGIISELERIGDYAEGIAKLSLFIGGQPQLAPPAGVISMARKSCDMLKGSIEAFLERDTRKAVRISEMDSEVDRLHDDVFRQLILLMSQDPGKVTQATWLLWVAHHLERFGDRVTNICEWVVFSTMGERVVSSE